MTPLFKKLNWKGVGPLLLLDAPASFEPELAALGDVPILRDPSGPGPVPFALSFVTTLAAVEAAVAAIAPRAPGDAVVWLAYPKRSSKLYKCEFHRDNGWDALGAAGFEPVRMVALDEDWSALRFRRVEHVKVMTRDPSRARTLAGKQRASPPATGFDLVRQIGLMLPGVEEGTAYGTPALRVRGKFLARLHDEFDALVLPIADDFERSARLRADPETFFITDHYAGTPYLLVRLSTVDPSELRDLLTRAWRDRAPKTLVAQFDQTASVPKSPRNPLKQKKRPHRSDT